MEGGALLLGIVSGDIGVCFLYICFDEYIVCLFFIVTHDQQ